MLIETTVLFSGLLAIEKEGQKIMAKKRGLYANIHAKRERIKRQKAAGKKPEKMRKKGAVLKDNLRCSNQVQ